MANTLTPIAQQNVSGVFDLRCYRDARVLAANTPETITVPTFTTQSGGTSQASRMIIQGTADLWIEGLNSATDGDIVSNGTFASDTIWTKGAGWTIAAGVGTATGAISTDISQTPAGLIPNRYYTVVYTITAFSAGTLTVKVGTTAGTARSSAATFTETILAGAGTDITFTGAGFTGSIDNVTVTPAAFAPTADITSGYAPVLIPYGSKPREFYVGTCSTISIASAGVASASIQWFKS